MCLNLYKFNAALVLSFLILASGTAVAADAPRPAISTIWGEKVTSENCWREYPRPQMVREGWTCLNGDWEYQVTSVTNTAGRPSEWAGKIRVPFAIESPLSGVGRLLEPDELLWYTRKFEYRPELGRRLILHFDCVDFRTMVFIGHREVTAVPHEGGQLPFALDITDYVRAGENELTVCVWDPTGTRNNGDFINSRGKQDINPGGCFYTRSSGIVGSVWTESVCESYINGYRVETDFDRGTAKISFEFAGRRSAAGVKVSVDGVGTFEGSDSIEVKFGDKFEAWSPDNPHLYQFTAVYGQDAVRGYFGMRKIEKRRDAAGYLRFFLNNEPVFLLGTLDQGWWPDGLLTPPSDEAMVFDIKTLKDCGYNMMRKHIKIEPLRYYYHCDRLGLVLIQDLPCGSGDFLDPHRVNTVRSYQLQRVEMKGMIDLLQQSPSIVMWNPYNEGWSQPGEFLTHSMLDFVREYDPTRLVNGPSGCWDWEGGVLLPNGWVSPDQRIVTAHKPHGVCETADTVDYHLYRGPYMLPANERRISFLGEFGGLGQAVSNHLWNAASGNWGYGGMGDTATREGLEKTYGKLMDKLAEYAAQGLGGAVYTQTTDVEVELNGLLTYDRKVLKFDPYALRKMHDKVYAAALAQAKPAAVGKSVRRLTLKQFRNRAEAAWLGQSIGVVWGAPTEFKFNGQIVPADKVPAYTPGMINGVFSQDDLYVEMTFLRTLEQYGLDATIAQAGVDFAKSEYPLWCANLAARNNLRAGITPPNSGHPRFNKCPNDIDYQIEADFAGIISPGMADRVWSFAERFGRLMNYGDGVLGGVFMGAMYAEAYFAKSVDELIAAGLAAIPYESDYAEMVRSIVAWHRQNPSDWEWCWRQIEAKYHPEGKWRWQDTNGGIDARINGAQVVLGLLYGAGELEKTMLIAMRGGYDSDCNPSSAAGPLAAMLGLKAIPARFLEGFDRNRKFDFTAYSFDALLKVTERLARENVLAAGGRVEKDEKGEEVWELPVKAVKVPKYVPSHLARPAE